MSLPLSRPSSSGTALHPSCPARAEKTLPEEQRREINVRAWHWLVDHGAPVRAARYALAAGHEREALELMSVSLNDELNKGHNGTVSEWLARMPDLAIQSNPQLRLVALWMNAFVFHLDDVMKRATALVDDPAIDAEMRADAIAALATALAMVDRYDDARRYASLCRAGAKGARARFALTYLEADIAFHAGQMETTRRLIGPVADGRVDPLEEIWRDFKTVLSYLCEGRPAFAEQIARPKHARWEAEVGRRGPWAALIYFSERFSQVE